MAINAHAGSVTTVAFNADGARLVTGGDDGTARVWDATSGRELVVIIGLSTPVMSVSFSANGARIVTGYVDGTVRQWELADATSSQSKSVGRDTSLGWKRCRVMLPLPVAPYEPSWADFDPEGNLLDWNDAAADHWLFRVRDGVSEPVEAAL